MTDKTILAERIESDLIGLLAIPRHVLYGVHTRRAELNFDVSGLRALLDQSLVLATPLATLIGYSKAAYLSKKALVDKRNLRDVFEEENVLTESQAHQIFGDTAEFANVSKSARG